MNIYSFHKISRPVYECGATIDLTPKGKWFVEVRRTDGTIRYPFGDNWIDNLFLNGYADGQLGGAVYPGSGAASGSGWADTQPNTISSGREQAWSFLDLFYGAKSSIAVGSGTTPVVATDTALATPIRFDSTAYATGNSISWSSTSGNIVYTIKESFPSETGSVNYNEAGIRIEGGTGTASINGLTTTSSNRLINRVVFPGSVSLSAGEQLILTVAVTIPSLASSAGKTITIAAQNGVNISGVLKCIGTSASMTGGTVTAAGVATRDVTHPLLFNSAQAPVALLSTKTTFDTLGVNPTWGTTNETSGFWSVYNNGSRYRDAGYQWNVGTPANDTNFRSLLFRKVTTAGAMGGYQLLLDNQMTKAAGAALSLSLRFQI